MLGEALKCTNHLVILNKMEVRGIKEREPQMNNIKNEKWTTLLDTTEIKENTKKKRVT